MVRCAQMETINFIFFHEGSNLVILCGLIMATTAVTKQLGMRPSSSSDFRLSSVQFLLTSDPTAKGCITTKRELSQR